MFAEDIDILASQIISAAMDRGVMIATAESCTGGLVSAALTAIPGSSAVLDRGFVTYSNAAKTEMLDVPASLIAIHGAVSEAVAEAMAKGAVSRSAAQLSISVTGIAGPDGGSDDKPVGLVHFAACGPAGTVHARHRFGDIGRQGIRLASVRTALAMLLDQLRA